MRLSYNSFGGAYMKDDIPNVVIVTARCSKTKQPFGVRFEEKDRNLWLANWTFAINTDVAQREGFDKSKINGSFTFDADYPGCPHCGSMIMFQCQCGKNACWDGASKKVVCPWCGNHGSISGIVKSLKAGVDI